MASLRKYLFGEPPFGYLANHLAQDDEFLEDSQRIIALSHETYLRLSTEINKSDVFLDYGTLETIARESIGGPDAKKIATAVYKLARILHSADMPADSAMNLLAGIIEEKTTRIEPTENRRILTQRIRTLAAEPTGFARQFKAKELAGATGAELADFRLVCDIRPIFDRRRERVEGAMPITIFQMEYRKADGDSGILELRITEKQITKLEEKFSDAKKKLKLVSELLASQKLSVPNVGVIDANADA